MDAERGNRLELGEEARDDLVGLDVADLDVAVLGEPADVERGAGGCGSSCFFGILFAFSVFNEGLPCVL